MSDTIDDLNALKQFHREERDAALPGRREELRALAKEGYDIRALDGQFDAAFHYRINSRLDIWPSRNRFRFLDGQRFSGVIRESQSITEFVHEKLPLKAPGAK